MSDDNKTLDVLARCLYSDMLYAQYLYEYGESGGRKGALAAVVACLEFIHHANPSLADLDGPLRGLMLALHDLESGSIAEMLRPQKIENRPKDGLERRFLKADAAIALDTLMKLGMKKNQASERVAGVLKKCGFQLTRRDADIASAIRSWRDSLAHDCACGPEVDYYRSARRGLTENEALEWFRACARKSLHRG